MSEPWLGSYGWERGPLVIGPSSAKGSRMDRQPNRSGCFWMDGPLRRGGMNTIGRGSRDVLVCFVVLAVVAAAGCSESGGDDSPGDGDASVREDTPGPEFDSKSDITTTPSSVT